MKIGFDVISDLNLSPDETFNWENKATSLYCIIAGNISDDLRTIRQTLAHLSKFYQGVFYIAGELEFSDRHSTQTRVNDLYNLCRGIRNVAFLHNHVVIVDGIAIVGVNGWTNGLENSTLVDHIAMEVNHYDDLGYLSSTIEKLQLHLDVKKIVVVSHSVPNSKLFFGEVPEEFEKTISLSSVLPQDSERKISHWIYGSYNKIVDTTIDGINYVNNSYYKRKPYWAKRVEVNF